MTTQPLIQSKKMAKTLRAFSPSWARRLREETLRCHSNKLRVMLEFDRLCLECSCSVDSWTPAAGRAISAATFKKGGATVTDLHFDRRRKEFLSISINSRLQNAWLSLQRGLTVDNHALRGPELVTNAGYFKGGEPL